jgi:hypothetical protein
LEEIYKEKREQGQKEVSMEDIRKEIVKNKEAGKKYIFYELFKSALMRDVMINNR